MKAKAADVSVAIESLDRWERIPGEYFVLRVGEGPSGLVRAQNLLWLLGIRSELGREVLWVEGRQWRTTVLTSGDYVTFRRRRDGDGWSVITYEQADFECRYRLAREEPASPIGEAAMRVSSS